MRYVKTDEIKIGQRLAKPIYSKEGVLLYGRGTSVSQNVINRISDMDTYGYYVLEPTEPLPVISEDELQFELFQITSCITLKKELDSIIEGEPATHLDMLAKKIVDNYGSLSSRITFIQSIRGSNDNIYKHTLNVAILCAMIANKLGIDRKEQYFLVMAAFYHDIGKLLIPKEILEKPDKLNPEELALIHSSEIEGYDRTKKIFDLSANIKRYISQLRIELLNKLPGHEQHPQKLLLGTKIIQVADIYDILTAMRIYKAPTSEFDAITFLLDNEASYDEAVIDALINSINILPPGCCIELTNGEKALVLSESEYFPLRPTVLSFGSNTLYDLSNRKTYESVKIKSVLKTLDNRFIMSKPENT